MIKTKVKTGITLSALALSISASLGAAPMLSSPVQSNSILSADNPLPKRYIVKFKNADASGFSRSSQTLNQSSYQPRANEVFSHFRSLNSASATQMKRIGRSNSYSVKLDNKNVQSLALRADVDYVEEDMPRRLLSETTPWGQRYVGATTLSDDLTGNRTICIIDSGYDRGHNDLNANNVTGTNNAGTGNWFEPGNNNAHGTHVAGTIAAIANNEGVIGVMPNQQANIHIIKVFNEDGWGYSSDLVSAVDTCVDNGANVVTMSLGGPGSSIAERNALAAHENQGVLLIAAAGNDGNSAHSYPASYDSVMSVASVDSEKDHSSFSQFTNQVEISGPGTAVLSTVTRGEGRLADIIVAGQSYFDDGIVPHHRFVRSGGSHAQTPFFGSATATLAECSVNGTQFNCGNMANKICLVERVENEAQVGFPEINPVKACHAAGASGIIVYSNAELPGLQNPFLVDSDNEISVVSVTVDRATGLALREQVGSTVTVEHTGNEDYEYYNGTSMATPHVSGVATLVWSYHTECSAAQIRTALIETAEDLDTAGRDNRTGHGLVDAGAAKAFLDHSCDGPINQQPDNGDTALTNGEVKRNLSGEKNDEFIYTIEVPAGATDLNIALNGGPGDADLYLKYAMAPTTNDFECRSWNSGNTESCAVQAPQAGTYYVMLHGYSAFSGADLAVNFTESSNGGAVTYTNNQPVTIPDNSIAGASSTITSTHTGDAGVVIVNVDISHTYIGDLRVELQSPDGQNLVLHDNTGGNTQDIIQSYTVDMSGSDSTGDWTLNIVDSARSDIGILNTWGLSFQ